MYFCTKQLFVFNRLFFTGYAVIQFPETLQFLYQSMKRHWIAQKSLTSPTADAKKVKERSIQGYEDVQRLNQLIYEKRAKNDHSDINLSTDQNNEDSMDSNTTVIEILSKAIARIDAIETKLTKVCETNEVEINMV